MPQASTPLLSEDEPEPARQPPTMPSNICQPVRAMQSQSRQARPPPAQPSGQARAAPIACWGRVPAGLPQQGHTAGQLQAPLVEWVLVGLPQQVPGGLHQLVGTPVRVQPVLDQAPLKQVRQLMVGHVGWGVDVDAAAGCVAAGARGWVGERGGGRSRPGRGRPWPALGSFSQRPSETNFRWQTLGTGCTAHRLATRLETSSPLLGLHTHLNSSAPHPEQQCSTPT